MKLKLKEMVIMIIIFLFIHWLDVIVLLFKRLGLAHLRETSSETWFNTVQLHSYKDTQRKVNTRVTGVFTVTLMLM